MEQSLENKTKPELKNRLTNFYKSNKVKIYSTLTILTLTLISFSYLKYNNEKKNILDEEKFVEAVIFLDENSITLKEEEDLILLKKALYLLKEKEFKAGNNLLQGLIDKNSNLKIIAEEILRK